MSPSTSARYVYNSLNFLNDILDGPPSRSFVIMSQIVCIVEVRFCSRKMKFIISGGKEKEEEKGNRKLKGW